MTTLRIICVGTLKERFITDACNEYIKRIGRFAKVNVVEIKETSVSDNPSVADTQKAVLDEGKRIIEALKLGKKKNEYVFACDISGLKLDSNALSQRIDRVISQGSGCMAFVIGGSYGLAPVVLDLADVRLSFSDMTFPHQLFRVMLLEQVYRSFKIINGEKYHK